MFCPSLDVSVVTVAWARVVPGLAAQWEPQGQHQHRLPLISQPVFTAESSPGVCRGAASRLLCTPLPPSELLLLQQEDGVREGSKVSGCLVHGPAQLSLDKHLAMSEQTCS